MDGDVGDFPASDFQNDGLGQFFGDVHRHQRLFGGAHDLHLVGLIGFALPLLAGGLVRFGLLASYLGKAGLLYGFSLALFGGDPLLLGSLFGSDAIDFCLRSGSLGLLCLQLKL